MSTSASDHEMSETSCSPLSYTDLESPYSSPSQQVPQLTTTLTGLSCTDNNLYNIVKNGTSPFLRILEQPQDHFRFRYVSEMVGTHGCLLGKTTTSKMKTHPTVELVNCPGKALIRCKLAQHNKPDEHPHKLLEEEQDRDVSYIVTERGNNKVAFPGMGIIHTAKKDVVNLLFKKHNEMYKKSSINAKELRAQCENMAKGMNLNIVRLKFSAHDVNTGKEICEPVFSDPIHNMKSAATNDLKICRMSVHSGRPKGGDDVYIFVEKVNKKNIMVRFFELDENGEVIWTENGIFLQSDVHHQYAIAFRTPPYRNSQTAVDVKVFIELVRPSDGRTSEPYEFTYKAEPIYKQIKKRKNNSYSSLESSSGGSITSDFPVTVFNHVQTDIKDECDIPALNIQPHIPMSSPQSECGLGNALGTVLNLEPQGPSPMWSQPAFVVSPSLPHLQLDSAELNTMARDIHMEDTPVTQEAWAQYIESFSSSLGDMQSEKNEMAFIRSTLVPDSGRIKMEPESPPGPSSRNLGRTDTTDQIKESSDYPAFYKPEDAFEVKKLVKELCEVIRNKKGHKNQEVMAKLEKLFAIRLSNGDTFLHMTLCSNQPSFETIVKVIHSVRMSHLLNLGNNKQQTILHLAVANGPPNIVSLLIAKGCNPMLTDVEEHNAIHYAVKYNNACLEPLLDAIKNNNVPCDLNATNCEKQSALHLCVLEGAEQCARLLLERGASYNVRDAHGRAPLHLCAYDGKVGVARPLLEHIATSDIDALDGHGNTALQIVCGRAMDSNSVELVKLLLDKNANPHKLEDNSESAWKLSRDKPQIREVIASYVSPEIMLEDDVKSEPEDEYESADDEMEGVGLVELERYAREVAARVEAAGAWRELATRLRADALCSWFLSQPSPAYTLLHHVKECRDDITSKSLALILEDMGLVDAANIIRSHIE